MKILYCFSKGKNSNLSFIVWATYFYILAVFFFSTLTSYATTRYVKPFATGNGNGSSWANASGDLQSMIDVSEPNDEVWVMAGVYKPNTYQTGSTGGASIRDYTFTIKNRVKVYGGFVGTETDLSQRTKAVIVVNPSILSGDVGALNDTTDNSRHVLVSIDNDHTTVFDGFVVKDGTNNRGGGAGMYINNSHINIINCLFTKNTAFGGSGLEILYSEPTITNCTFHENVATRWGGGAASIVESFPKITNCSFSSNSGGKGGAIFNVSSSSIFKNCTFSKNIATYDYDDSWVPRTGIGAAIFNIFSRLTEIKNCIFWGNTVLEEVNTGNHNSILYGDVKVNFSDVQNGGYPTGIGNISIDPSFYNIDDPDGLDNIFGTADDGLTLRNCSPAINTGDNTSIAEVTDITGASRVQKESIDMGAYESNFNTPLPNAICTVEGPKNLKVYSPPNLLLNVLFWEHVPFALNYEVYRSDNGPNGNYKLIGTNTNRNQFEDVFKSTDPIINYYYYVRAKLANGFTEPSNVAFGQPVPLTKLNLRVSEIGCHSLLLKWDYTEIGNEDVYLVYRSETGIEDSYELISKLRNSTRPSQFIDENRMPNVTYYYKIEEGHWYDRTEHFETGFASGRTTCGQSNELEIKVTTMSCSQLQINWVDVQGRSEESYELYRSINSAEGPFELVAFPAANITQWVDGQLNSNTKYYYTIRARFSDGFSGYSPASSAKTSAINLRLTNYCATKAVLEWDICTPHREKWVIKASTDNVNYYDLGETSSLTNYFEAINLEPDKTYYFAVQPVYSNGFSNFSAVVSAHLPKFPSPSDFKAKYTENKITLNWRDNSNGCDNEEGFVIMKKNESGEFYDYAVLNPNQTTFVDLNVVADKEYCYMVKSRYFHGFQYADGLCITTKTAEIAAVKIKKPTTNISKLKRGNEAEIISPNISDQLFIYPNPAKNELNYKLTEDLEGEIKIAISDLKGMIYFQNSFIKTVFTNEYKLDISQFKQGAYILSIYNENLKKDLKGKFVKIE